MPILTAEDRVGTLLAEKYRLERILGRGGMGVVFAATHTWTDRPVAVKLLHHDSARDASVAQRFLQEARSAATLRHPNVVDVLDMGQAEDGSVYLVLEMLDGESLAQRLERGPLSPSEALQYLLPIMDALDAAHAKGTVHRDMKPDNIFLSRMGASAVVPKVLDFGIAKRTDSSSLGVKTATGQLLGTPYYMSPEQARGANDLGPQSDVWSMGVVWFECLAAALPFNDESLGGLIIKLVSVPAPLLQDLAPSVPPSLARAVDRALLLDRSARHASMAAFAEAVRSAASESGLDAPALSGARNSSPGAKERVPRSSSPPEALAKTGIADSSPPATGAVPVETMSAVARNPTQTGANLNVGSAPTKRAPTWIVAAVVCAGLVGGSVVILRSRDNASRRSSAAPRVLTSHATAEPSATGGPPALPPTTALPSPPPVATPTAVAVNSSAAPPPVAAVASTDAGVAAHGHAHGHGHAAADAPARVEPAAAARTTSASEPAHAEPRPASGNGGSAPAIRGEW